jgi:hypothetical protein
MKLLVVGISRRTCYSGRADCSTCTGDYEGIRRASCHAVVINLSNGFRYFLASTARIAVAICWSAIGSTELTEAFTRWALGNRLFAAKTEYLQ